MNEFLARLDKGIFRLSVVVLVGIFAFAASVNNDWSVTGILLVVWGLAVTAVVFGAVCFAIDWIIRWLFG